MRRWQLRCDGTGYKGRERPTVHFCSASNRKFPELEILQLTENTDRRPVLIANFREPQ